MTCSSRLLPEHLSPTATSCHLVFSTELLHDTSFRFRRRACFHGDSRWERSLQCLELKASSIIDTIINFRKEREGKSLVWYWKGPLSPLAISPSQKVHVVCSLTLPGFSVIFRKTRMKIQAAAAEQRRNDLVYSGSKKSDKTCCTVNRCGWSMKGSKLGLYFKEHHQRGEFDSILLENAFNNSLSTTFVNSRLPNLRSHGWMQISKGNPRDDSSFCLLLGILPNQNDFIINSW